MRRARIKVKAERDEAVYHLVSRTVNGERILGVVAKEVLRRQIWQVADFAGLEILTYTILSNHFHILVRVPKREPISDEEVLRRYRVLYPRPTRYQSAHIEVIAAQLAQNTPEAVVWRERQLRLMYDVSQFMKLVKERFSIWYNARHQRFGPVWSDRFKSVLVEPKVRVIRTIAVYIDLNCVRAGIVRDPKDYRFCGYAEALSGNVAARSGVVAVTGEPWEAAQKGYRVLLFATAAGSREKGSTLTAAELQQVVRQGGKLPLGDVLRCRVRYFTESAVLGGREFVERHVAEYRSRFAMGPLVARRDLPCVTEWGELSGLRRIRGSLFG